MFPVALQTASQLAQAIPHATLGQAMNPGLGLYTQDDLKAAARTNFWVGATVFGLIGVIVGGVSAVVVSSYLERKKHEPKQNPIPVANAK